jgi:hypothetical protein
MSAEPTNCTLSGPVIHFPEELRPDMVEEELYLSLNSLYFRRFLSFRRFSFLRFENISPTKNFFFLRAKLKSPLLPKVKQFRTRNGSFNTQRGISFWLKWLFLNLGTEIFFDTSLINFFHGDGERRNRE